MATDTHNWTEEDEAEWQRIARVPIHLRDANDHHAFIVLQARRDLEIKRAALAEERERERFKRLAERSGPLYRPAVAFALAGFGSCGIGLSSDVGDLIGLGVFLVVVSGILNGLNQWLSGSRD